MSDMPGWNGASYCGDLLQQEQEQIRQMSAQIQGALSQVGALEVQKWRLMAQIDAMERSLHQAYDSVGARLGLAPGPWHVHEGKVYQPPHPGTPPER